ncbi:MAG: hypothetical protein ISS33_05405 [Candidatus Omnitrophica bacterium]|nr:hypothetical protein [Candidatus Omnitrophota bacterium]
MRKVISVVVLVTFLVNGVSYGLGVSPMSHKPIVMEKAQKMMRVLWAQKRGPGSDPVAEILKEMREKIERHEFVGEAPQIEAVIGNVDSLVYPLRISGGTTTDIVVAAEDFCRTKTVFAEALKEGKFSVVESSFAYDRENGEVPIARLEGENIDNCQLAIHSRHKAEFKDILEHDLRFLYKFDDKMTKVVSVAEGFFNVTVRHYLRDIEKDYKERTKSGGHLVGAMMRDVASEKDASNINGRYSLINDAIKLWFLASYSFNDTTRYNNNILEERLDWFYEHKEEFDFGNQFPNINDQNVEEVFNLVLFINYHYFSRKDKNGEPVKVCEFEDVESSPETENVNVLAYMGGKDDVAMKDKKLLKTQIDFIIRDNLFDVKVFQKIIDQNIPMNKKNKKYLTDMFLRLDVPLGLSCIQSNEKASLDSILKILREKDMIKSIEGRINSYLDGTKPKKNVRIILEKDNEPSIGAAMESERPAYMDEKKLLANRIKLMGTVKDKGILKKRIDAKIEKGLFNIDVFQKVIDQKLLNERDQKYLADVFFGIDNLSAKLCSGLSTGSFLTDVVSTLREDDMVEFVKEQIESCSKKEENEKIAQNKAQEAEDKEMLKKQINKITNRGLLESVTIQRVIEVEELSLADVGYLTDTFFGEMSARYKTITSIEALLKLLREGDMKRAIKDRRRELILEELIDSGHREILKKRLNLMVEKNLVDTKVFRNIITNRSLNREDVTYLVSMFCDCSDLFKQLNEEGDLKGLLLRLLREKDMLVFLEEIIGNVRTNKHKLTVEMQEKNEFDKVISNYILSVLGDKRFNGIMDLSQEHRTNIKFGLQEMQKINIEILVPFRPVKSLQKKYFAINNEMKKRSKSFVVKRFKTESNLHELLNDNGSDKDVLRIIISEGRTNDVISNFMKTDKNAKMLRDVRILRIIIPEMKNMDLKRKTALQAQIIMMAVCARALTQDNTESNLCVKALLEEMLEKCFDNKVFLENFMKNLVVVENEQTPARVIRNRIRKSLSVARAIRLTRELEHKLRLIEYFMRFA